MALSDAYNKQIMLRLNATSSSQPYMTLNTSYNDEGEKEVSFDPRTVSWEELSKLYADDDMLRTLFGMMQEWSKSAPDEGYVFKIDPSWFTTSTSKGTGSVLSTTTNSRSTSHVLRDAPDSTSVSGNTSLRYDTGDLIRVINDVTLTDVSITAPTDGPITASAVGRVKKQR